uniref:tRNA (guanine(26)-N(2))-dimethyltransferase n=1 Tax=Glossina morsitans morsitans TaxID=37546 RepID=A0A1B0GB95_GLOMM
MIFSPFLLVTEKSFANRTQPLVQYEDGLRILEALSATGMRSIRYAKEIAGVIANDLSKQAVEAMRDNVKRNKVEHLIEVSHADATTLTYFSASPSKQYDCIDLDPYGCPNRFLDAAIRSLKDGGLLLVTATNMAWPFSVRRMSSASQILLVLRI